MSRARPLFPALAFSLAATAVASGAELGSLRYDDQPAVALEHATTCTPRYDAIGFGKPEIVLLFSDRALDPAAVRAGVDCDAHAFELAVAAGDGVLLSLSFAPGLELSRVSVYGVGFALGSDPCAGCKATLSYAGNRVKGSVATTQPLDLNDSPVAFEVAFDLDRPGAPPAGTALPAGGGDPGKALLAYVKAYQEGDYETLERVLPPGKAEDEWGYYEAGSERKDAIQRDAELEPKSAKVLEGQLLGEFSLLIVQVPSLWSSDPQKALVGLSLVDGAWRVDDILRDLSGRMFEK
jgi:hypothetical protein